MNESDAAQGSESKFSKAEFDLLERHILEEHMISNLPVIYVIVKLVSVACFTYAGYTITGFYQSGELFFNTRPFSGRLTFLFPLVIPLIIFYHYLQYKFYLSWSMTMTDELAREEERQRRKQRRLKYSKASRQAHQHDLHYESESDRESETGPSLSVSVQQSPHLQHPTSSSGNIPGATPKSAPGCMARMGQALWKMILGILFLHTHMCCILILILESLLYCVLPFFYVHAISSIITVLSLFCQVDNSRIQIFNVQNTIYVETKPHKNPWRRYVNNAIWLIFVGTIIAIQNAYIKISWRTRHFMISTALQVIHNQSNITSSTHSHGSLSSTSSSLFTHDTLDAIAHYMIPFHHGSEMFWLYYPWISCLVYGLLVALSFVYLYAFTTAHPDWRFFRGNYRLNEGDARLITSFSRLLETDESPNCDWTREKQELKRSNHLPPHHPLRPGSLSEQGFPPSPISQMQSETAMRQRRARRRRSTASSDGILSRTVTVDVKQKDNTSCWGRCRAWCLRHTRMVTYFLPFLVGLMDSAHFMVLSCLHYPFVQQLFWKLERSDVVLQLTVDTIGQLIFYVFMLIITLLGRLSLIRLAASWARLGYIGFSIAYQMGLQIGLWLLCEMMAPMREHSGGATATFSMVSLVLVCGTYLLCNL